MHDGQPAGHSCGGLFAQLLVGNGLGSAGVSVDGAGAKGVKATPFSELRSSFPVLKIPPTGLFPGRDHYTCGEDGWETVADFALEWALAPQPGVLA